MSVLTDNTVTLDMAATCLQVADMAHIHAHVTEDANGESLTRLCTLVQCCVCQPANSGPASLLTTEDADISQRIEATMLVNGGTFRP